MNYPTPEDAAADDGAAQAPASGPAGDGRATRWANHREERRAELIRAARRAVHRLGPDVPMEDIASAASTSKSVFYRYFRDKAGLAAAMGELVLAQMQERIAQAAAAAESPYDGLRAMVHAYLAMAARSPNVYEFVTRGPAGAASDPAAGDAAGAAFGTFFDAVGAMIEAPMRRHLDPGSRATLDYWPCAAIGLVRAAGERWLTTPPSSDKPSLDDMAGLIADWLYDGIAAQASPAVVRAPLPAAKEHS